MKTARSDVNVLVYAHRSDSTAEHDDFAGFVTGMVTGPSAFALSEAVLSGFIRVVTNPRIFKDPTLIEMASNTIANGSARMAISAGLAACVGGIPFRNMAVRLWAVAYLRNARLRFRRRFEPQHR